MCCDKAINCFESVVSIALIVKPTFLNQSFLNYPTHYHHLNAPLAGGGVEGWQRQVLFYSNYCKFWVMNLAKSHR